MKVTIEWIIGRKPKQKGFYLVETDDHDEAICAFYKNNKWYYTNYRPEMEITQKNFTLGRKTIYASTY